MLACPPPRLGSRVQKLSGQECTLRIRLSSWELTPILCCCLCPSCSVLMGTVLIRPHHHPEIVILAFHTPFSVFTSDLSGSLKLVFCRYYQVESWLSDFVLVQPDNLCSLTKAFAVHGVGLTAAFLLFFSICRIAEACLASLFCLPLN